MHKPIRDFFTQQKIVMILFVVFLFLRLFVNLDSVLLSGDNLKYLQAAKNFPYHTLYNNQLYLLHPPFYPYAIHFFTIIFQEDHIASIFISLISAVITFFLLYHLFMMLTRNFDITFLILVFYTLSVGLITSSYRPAKESFVIMLIISSIYFYIKGVKFNNKKSIVIASVLGGILGVTSDHVVFLVPTLILSYIFFNRKQINFKNLKLPNLAYTILPLLLILMFYGSWSFIKFYNYATNEYYVNGYEGSPVSTHDLGLLQVISPGNFEDFEGTHFNPEFYNIKRIAFNFGYMLNIEPFSIPLGLNFTTMKYLLFPRHIAYMAIIYLPLAIAALVGLLSILKDFIKTKTIYNNVGLYIIALFIVFIFPLTQKLSSPRFILTSYIFLFYIISYGIIAMLQKKKRQKFRISSNIFSAIAILLLLLVPFWYYSHPYFILFDKKIISGQSTGDFVNANLPKGAGIMAQPGYGIKLIYLTGNRIIGLHHDPSKLPYLINLYNIDYIITGRFYTEVRGLSRDSAEYVKNNPDKFELIATIHEDYSDFFVEEDLSRTDEVYIYKVRK